jgi:hypothetical protein
MRRLVTVSATTWRRTAPSGHRAKRDRPAMTGHSGQWFACAVLLVVIAGCGARNDHGTSGGGTTAPTTSPSVTPSSPSPSPSAVAPSPPVAADGTSLAACADGTCEVAVSGPVRIKLRDGTFSVTKIEATVAMDFELRLSAGGGGSGTLKGTCGTVATFYLGGGGSGKSCDSTGIPATPPPIQGAVSIQLVGWSTDGAAVLRLVSG